MNDYKLRHEEFMSNLSGTSVSAVAACIYHLPCFILAVKCVQVFIEQNIFVDFILVVVPLLVTATVGFSSNGFSLFCLTTLFTLILWKKKLFNEPENIHQETKKDHNNQFLSLFKGSV